jgi:aminoglycoside 6-adenylyltransferase
LAGSHHARPFEVIVDKDGVVSTILAAAAEATTSYSEENFFEIVHWFWAGTLMCAKAVARDELWIAMTRTFDTNQNLLRMIEWDHKLRYGWSYDTWFGGKYFRRWADLDVVSDVERCFAKMGTTEMAEALVFSMDLFERLAVRTGQTIAAPIFNHGKVRAEVHTILAAHTRGRRSTGAFARPHEVDADLNC